MASLTGRARRRSPSLSGGAAYLLALVGAVCLGLWVVGDLSSEPYDSPVGGSVLGLRLPEPLYGDGPGTMVTGVVGVVLVVAAVLLTHVSRRHLSRAGTAWLWLGVAWSGLVGLALGAALRVLLAITWDANIGGGLVLLLGLPVLALAWLLGLVPLGLSRRAARTADPGP